MDKIEENVGVDTGVVPPDGFADSGVDADSVANKSEAGVGADVPTLQARSVRRRNPLQRYIFLFIFMFLANVCDVKPYVYYTTVKN